MKKFSLITLVVSSMLFVACGDKTKETVKEVQESASQTTSNAVDAAAAAVNEAKAKAAQIAQEAKESAAKATEATKAKAAEITKATEEKAAQLAEDAKAKAVSLAEAAKTKAAEATKVVKEKIHEATAPSVDMAAAKSLYAKCAGCHGKDGKTKALGKSAIIAGQDSATLVESMKAYKAGTRNISGMGTLMKGQVSSMSDSDIEAVAVYISTL